MVREPCPVLSPFLGCLSGSSELAWVFVELLWTYEVRFSVSGCALHPGLCLGWASWGIPCCLFLALFPGGGGVSFAFVMGFVAKTQSPPLLLGLRASLYRPNQRETIAIGDCYILCGRSGVTWSAWAAHRQRCERFPFAAGCNMKEYRRPLAPDAVVTGVLALGHGTVCFVSFELGTLVRSVSSL